MKVFYISQADKIGRILELPENTKLETLFYVVDRISGLKNVVSIENEDDELIFSQEDFGIG